MQGRRQRRQDGRRVPGVRHVQRREGRAELRALLGHTLNQATTSGKTKKFKSLNKDSCDTCADFAKQLDDIYGAGGHVETDGFKVKKMPTRPGSRSRAPGVSVVLTATPQKVYKSKGARPARSRAATCGCG